MNMEASITRSFMSSKNINKKDFDKKTEVDGENDKNDDESFDFDQDLIRVEVLNTKKKSKSLMSEIEMLNSVNKDSGKLIKNLSSQISQTSRISKKIDKSLTRINKKVEFTRNQDIISHSESGELDLS